MAPRIQDIERLFKALGDATRLRILALLSGGEVCVCHIHESLQVPQPTVSRHLAYLRRAGLVDVRRDGLWAHYRMAPAVEPSIRAALDAAVHAVGHVPSAAADERRLGRQVFRPSPGAVLLPVAGCCASSTAARRSEAGTPATALRASGRRRPR